MNRRAFLNGTTLRQAPRSSESDRRWPQSRRPETTKLRVALSPAICFAPPVRCGGGLLQSEGFTRIEYVKAATGWGALISGEADVSAADVPSIVTQIDKGQPIVVLGGMHVGCYELFGTDRVRTIVDRKGKKRFPDCTRGGIS